MQAKTITLPNRILAKISLPVLMQDTRKTKNLNFGYGMCAHISGYFFDESNTEQIVFTA